MNESQEAQLREAVAGALSLDPDEVDDSTGMDTTPGWSSLAHLAVMANVEDAFGVQFTMDEMAGAKNVGDLKEILRKSL